MARVGYFRIHFSETNQYRQVGVPSIIKPTVVEFHTHPLTIWSVINERITHVL